MKAKDFDSFVFNGKNYSLLSKTFQDAFFTFGLFTLRYYPQEKLLIVSDRLAQEFHIEKFFSNMSLSFPKALFADSEKQHFVDFIKKLEKGEKKIFDFFELRNERTCRLTLVVCDTSKDGSPLTAIGLLEDVEEEKRSDRLFKALSRDFGSIYYVNVESNRVTPYRISDEIRSEYGEKINSSPHYDEIVTTYIRNTVLDVEQDEMSKMCSVQNLEKEFKKRDVLIHDYRGMRNGKVIYCRMKVANISKGKKFTAFMIAFSDMTKSKTLEVERLAYVDQVTGGNNYNYFKRKILEISKTGYFVSMDIHQFKTINQICGVQTGDMVLKGIWETLLKFIKKDDIAARVNADHFIIYAPQSTRQEVTDGIGTLSSGLVQLSKRMRCPRLNAYFGIAKWDPSKPIEEVYSYTTIAKHSIKDDKNKNYQFYSEDEGQRVIENKNMEDGFSDAIMNDNFKVYYQPKINPVTGKIVGAEALVRWQLDNGDIIPPGKFIPVFEKDGLIRILDEYIFGTVCRFVKERLALKKTIMPVSVNLSRASICYEGVVEQYARIVEETGIDPKYVPIEITESAAASNTAIQEISYEFNKKGFVLCMDDFGTGYSSIALLNLLPFNNIKLDKTLIDGIGDVNGLKLIKHIIALSKDLGLTITAEGVESKDQKDSLVQLQCDNIQGFFYHRPLPEAEFVKLL